MSSLLGVQENLNIVKFINLKLNKKSLKLPKCSNVQRTAFVVIKSQKVEGEIYLSRIQ